MTVAQKTIPVMLLRATNILTLIASILLLAALSIEIIYYRELESFTSWFTLATAIVCIIYCLDFIVLTVYAPHPLRFLLRNFYILILSIPYHSIATILDIEFSRTVQIIMSGGVVLRSVMALFITLRWLIARRTTRLLWAYVATVVLSGYVAALLFYEYEAPVNHTVASFGDALWWSWMNLTTVGAEIFPVTVIGKILCVLLPILGMAMFPVFTVYVTSLYNGTQVADKSDKPKID